MAGWRLRSKRAQEHDEFTVPPHHAFNCFNADSVLILDCCISKAPLLLEALGAVALDPELPLLEAAKIARQKALEKFVPDISSVAILLDDYEGGRGLEVARWLVDQGHCTRVMRVVRDAFVSRYGFLMGSEFQSYPSEILEGELFLGSLFTVKESVLEHLGITHVVSVMERAVSVPFACKHLQCRIPDSTVANLTPVMVEALPFIAEALAAGGRVLVHCEQGQSRSASVVAAHLMSSEQVGIHEALAVLRKHRPSVRPNEGFMRQLEERNWSATVQQQLRPKRPAGDSDGPSPKRWQSRAQENSVQEELTAAELTEWLQGRFTLDSRQPEHESRNSNLGACLAQNFRSEVIQKRELQHGLGVVLDNVLTRCECQHLIEATETIGYGYTSFPQAYRGNRRLQLDDAELAGLIWRRICDFVPAKLHVDYMPKDGDYPDGIWEPVGCNERFRFSKYFAGDCFKMHCDQLAHFHSSLCSFLTVNFYLNDLLENQEGRTRFYLERGGPSVDAAGGVAGSVALFKQESVVHDGEKLASGLKYLMRTDVIFKKVALQNQALQNQALQQQILATNVAPNVPIPDNDDDDDL